MVGSSTRQESRNVFKMSEAALLEEANPLVGKTIAWQGAWGDRTGSCRVVIPSNCDASGVCEALFGVPWKEIQTFGAIPFKQPYIRLVVVVEKYAHFAGYTTNTRRGFRVVETWEDGTKKEIPVVLPLHDEAAKLVGKEVRWSSRGHIYIEGEAVAFVHPHEDAGPHVEAKWGKKWEELRSRGTRKLSRLSEQPRLLVAMPTYHSFGWADEIMLPVFSDGTLHRFSVAMKKTMPTVEVK